MPEPDSASWIRIAMVARRKDGGVVDVELIRSRHLIEAEGLSVGSRIHFEVEELNISGEAEILAITSWLNVPSGDGSVVTGRFATRRAVHLAVVRLADSDLRESILE